MVFESFLFLQLWSWRNSETFDFKAVQSASRERCLHSFFSLFSSLVLCFCLLCNVFARELSRTVLTLNWNNTGLTHSAVTESAPSYSLSLNVLPATLLLHPASYTLTLNLPPSYALTPCSTRISLLSFALIASYYLKKILMMISGCFQVALIASCEKLEQISSSKSLHALFSHTVRSSQIRLYDRKSLQYLY